MEMFKGNVQVKYSLSSMESIGEKRVCGNANVMEVIGIV